MVYIRLKRDTKTNWETYNPILTEGELGVDTESKLIKIGNGLDNWLSLSYFNIDAVDGGGANDFSLFDPGLDPIFVEDTSWSKGFNNSSSIIYQKDYTTLTSMSGLAENRVNDTSLFVGYRQASGINQDPVVSLYDSLTGNLIWERTDYDITGSDSRAVGSLWDGGSHAYIFFTTDGTQGSSSEDFRRFCNNGWLTSYGAGGGAKVSIILKIDMTDGSGIEGTFASAVLNNGNSNYCEPKNGYINSNGNILGEFEAYYTPRGVDKSKMTNISGETSPYDYQIEFNPNLTQALSTHGSDFESTYL